MVQRGSRERERWLESAEPGAFRSSSIRAMAVQINSTTNFLSDDFAMKKKLRQKWPRTVDWRTKTATHWRVFRYLQSTEKTTIVKYYHWRSNMTSDRFQKIKTAFKIRTLEDIKDIHKNVTMALKAIIQQEFQKCFQQHRRAKCRAPHGENLEGDRYTYNKITPKTSQPHPAPATLQTWRMSPPSANRGRALVNMVINLRVP
jgi:hypothetical protein